MEPNKIKQRMICSIVDKYYCSIFDGISLHVLVPGNILLVVLVYTYLSYAYVVSIYRVVLTVCV